MNPCPVCGTEAGENKNYTCAKCGAEVTTPTLISAEEYFASLADIEAADEDAAVRADAFPETDAEFEAKWHSKDICESPDGGFYHRNEVDGLEGPFNSVEEARAAFVEYVKHI